MKERKNDRIQDPKHLPGKYRNMMIAKNMPPEWEGKGRGVAFDWMTYLTLPVAVLFGELAMCASYRNTSYSLVSLGKNPFT